MVAYLELGHAGPGCGDDAGRQLARHERQLRLELVAAAHHHQVDEIDRGGLDLQQHFAGLRLGLRHLAERSLLDAAELTNHHCAHQPSYEACLACQRTGSGASRPCAMSSAIARLSILPFGVSGISSIVSTYSGMSNLERPAASRCSSSSCGVALLPGRNTTARQTFSPSRASFTGTAAA